MSLRAGLRGAGAGDRHRDVGHPGVAPARGHQGGLQRLARGARSWICGIGSLIAWSAWLCIVWRCARSGQPRTVARIKHAHMRPDHRSQVRKCAGRLHGESALLRTWQGPPISGSAGTRCYSWGGLSNGPGSVLSSTTVGVPAGLAHRGGSLLWRSGLLRAGVPAAVRPGAAAAAVHP